MFYVFMLLCLYLQIHFSSHRYFISHGMIFYRTFIAYARDSNTMRITRKMTKYEID